MVKPALYSRDAILDTVVRAVHERGHAATLGDVTAILGAPSGSIYHRFGSRKELFVAAWIRSVRRFQATFAEVADVEDPVGAIVATGLLVPRYCRAEPGEARMLTLYRHAHLMADPPAGLETELAGLNDAVRAHLVGLAKRRYGRVAERELALVALAARDTPYGMVRGLIGGEIPDWMDEPIAAAIRAVALLEVR
ncbi:TetR family transcriptional regulator [Nocardioides panzhihuensis]|uniref:AcrR family transcriptional regulator n=1 Tax=Nocardioides panzhihuensis TaxID=860243 RepID=A0A7Z0DLS0_9ACTN|nr:AcrR family transcriptional regulator [Nocardioides panzhihuensis]